VFHPQPQVQNHLSFFRGDQPHSGHRMRGGSDSPGFFSSSSPRSKTTDDLQLLVYSFHLFGHYWKGLASAKNSATPGSWSRPTTTSTRVACSERTDDLLTHCSISLGQLHFASFGWADVDVGNVTLISYDLSYGLRGFATVEGV
jgi:hypothetical protein